MNYGPPTPYTQDDLIDLLRRCFADNWVTGLLNDPTSLSVFIGWAAAMLRLQASNDETFTIDAFIFTAPGGLPALSTARVQRPSGALVTIPTTLRIKDQNGAVWRAVAPVVIPASGSAQSVDIPIRTDRVGYWLNSFLPLSYQFIDPPPDKNLVIVLGQDPASGGKSPFLDLHGAERSKPRNPGESDATYAARIALLEDQVSPRALAETLIQVLDGYASTKFIADLVRQYGMRPLQETFEDSAQPAQEGVFFEQAAFFDAGFFFDDPYNGVMLDIGEVAAFFDVYLPTPVGPDASNAIAALADELDRKRAYGVRFKIVFGEDVPVVRHGFAVVTQGAWALGGAPTPVDALVALKAFDGDRSYVASVVGAGAGAPSVADDLRVSVKSIPTPVSVHHVVLRARLRKVENGGTDPEIAFVIRPSTAGAAARVLVNDYPRTVDHEDFREYAAILEQNPVTSSPWSIPDVVGTFEFGLANAATGPTDEMRASELLLELVLNYG